MVFSLRLFLMLSLLWYLRLLVAFGLVFFIWAICCCRFHPLRSIPCPFWSSIYWFRHEHDTEKGNSPQSQRDWHREYGMHSPLPRKTNLTSPGPLVRIKPGEVLCSDPNAIEVSTPKPTGQESAKSLENLRPDILQKMITTAVGRDRNVDLPVEHINTELLAALFGGTEPTHDPKKVTTEIESAYAERKSQGPLSYKEASDLPYLKACIKKSMRLHPAVSYPLPRTVPPGGATISGVYVPAGYRVGINPAVVQYDKEVFGDDADEYNPESWLKGDADVQRMDKAMFPFGGADDGCIGKNMALCLVYKTIPSILRRFEIHLANEREPPKRNFWFNLLHDVRVRFKVKGRDSEEYWFD
ncbi:cytochrome P450 [Aspergillus filifer]